MRGWLHSFCAICEVRIERLERLNRYIELNWAKPRRQCLKGSRRGINIPNEKNYKDPTQNNSYRGINSISILGNVFGHVLLGK